MTKTLLLMFVAVLSIGAVDVGAQAPDKAPDYKLAKIKIVPYDSATGQFGEEITPASDRSFFNDLSISLFVVVEVEGLAGSFESGRKLRISVSEDSKVKTTRFVQIGLIGENGKWFEPLWLYPAMCGEVRITASLVGQKPSKALTRTVPFTCGE